MSVIKKIIEELNEFGISKSTVQEILNPKEMEYFEDILNFYKNSLNDKQVKKRIKEIKNKNSVINVKHKQYEINHDIYLRGPLNFENLPLIQLYTSKKILKIAKEYIGDSFKIRNPLAWIHPPSNLKKEIRSQKWHRDQEDFKMLKVFILFSKVNEQNGPTHYVKSTKHESRYGNISPNMTWAKNHWSKKNKLFYKIYNKYREIIPFNYPIPKKNIIKATGKIGTIYFIDTNGLHKGGYVKEGIRLMTHCNFLRSNSPMLSKGGYLENLNSDNKLFSFDFNSEEFLSLSNDQKQILI